MKKIVSLILCIILVTFSLAPAVRGISSSEESKEFFDDGSYVVTGFNDDETFDSDLDAEESTESSFIQKLIDLLKRILRFFFGEKVESKDENENNTVKPRTVSKTKYAKYYDSQDRLLWSVYLTGYFRYDGEKVECTDVSVSYDIKDSDWKLISVEGSKQENTATGRFVIRQYKLGVPLKEIEKKLTLICDPNGKVK